jgi:hypothetical protein
MPSRSTDCHRSPNRPIRFGMVLIVKLPGSAKAHLSAAGQSGRTKLDGLNAADHQIYVELFDAAGNVQSGFALLAPGQFTDVVVSG